MKPSHSGTDLLYGTEDREIIYVSKYDRRPVVDLMEEYKQEEMNDYELTDIAFLPTGEYYKLARDKNQCDFCKCLIF